MSATIREVILKLKVQLDQTKIQVPDTTAYKAAYADTFKDIGNQYDQLRKRLSAQLPVAMPLASANGGGTAAGSNPTLNAAVMAAERQAQAEKKLIQSLEQKQIGLMQGAAASQVYSIQNSMLSDTAKQAAISLVMQNDALKKQAAASTIDAAELKKLTNEYERMEAAAAKSAGSLIARESLHSTAQQNAAVNSAIGGRLAAAGDSFKQAGEGVITFTRGIMLLNSSSEEELAILVRKLALYQSYFDLFRGGFDAIKGTVTGIGHLGEAQRTLSLAATNSSGAMTGLAGGLVKGRAAVTAMYAAMSGPYGAAAFVLLGTGVAIYRSLTDAAKEHAEEVERNRIAQLRFAADVEGNARRAERAYRDLSTAMRITTQYAEKSALASQINDVNRGAITPGLKSNDFLNERERADEDRRLQAEVFQGQQSQVFKEAQASRTRFAGTALSLTGRDSADAGLFAEGGSSFDQLRKNLKELAGSNLGRDAATDTKLSNAKVALSQAPDDSKLQQNVLNIERERSDLYKLRERAQGAIATQALEELTLNQKSLTVLQQRGTALQSLMEQERARLDANRAALKEESRRNMSAAQRFGQLDPMEQQRQLTLARKASEGGVESLSKGERDEYRQGGFANAAFSHFDLAQGNKAGAQELFKLAGTFDTEAGGEQEGQNKGENRADFLKRQQTESLKNMQSAEQMMGEIIKQQSDARDEVIKGLEKVATETKLLESVGRLGERVKAMFDALESKMDGVATDVKNGRMQGNR